MEFDIDAVCASILSSTDPSIKKMLAKAKRTKYRHRKKAEFLEKNPDYAMERSKNIEEKEKEKEQKKLEREMAIQSSVANKIEEIKAAKKKYIEEAGVNEKMFEIVNRIEFHERPEYIYTSITYNGNKFLKYEATSQSDADSWVVEQLTNLAEDELGEEAFCLDM